MSILCHAPPCLVILLLFLPHSPGAASVDTHAAYTAADLILLNCGALSELTDNSGRTWNSDENAGANFSSAHTVSHIQLHRSLPGHVPYSTVRLFHSTVTYPIAVNTTGQKFIRLYFDTQNYEGFDTSKSFFSVVANGYILLSNFSAFLYALSRNETSFRKEFQINVQGNPRIDLTFSPNPDSFAFLNGIEIVSLPDDLYFRNKPIKQVPDQLFDLKNDIGLETLYRLNVGGGDVQISNDSGSARGMFREWQNDNDYIRGSPGYTPHDVILSVNYTHETPPYSAPDKVYTSSRVISNDSTRLDWAFPVDSGFHYMLRCHFCEFQLEIHNPNERVFDVQIDNQTAELEADVIFWTRSSGTPVFKDYIAWVSDDGSRGKKDLWLSLFPNNEGKPKYLNALLNGLEIFKLSDSKQSLAAANPNPTSLPANRSPAFPLAHTEKKNRASVIFIVIGSMLGFLAVVAGVSFSIFRWRLKTRDSRASKPSGVPLQITLRSKLRTGGSLLSDLCRHFSIEEIKMATHNFDDSFLIGKGGFGNVYKGFINDGTTPVAVKRLHDSSNQGAQEFMTEIELLSKLRYLHLVSLIGYCDDVGEMILVYDYMAHGTLRDHLCNTENPPLTWKHRLEICLGAAKGLHYLHTGTKEHIIHRDVKSTNILLDEKWVAKVSDFGLSKVGPSDTSDMHVSTAVKGSFGYIDPEYYRLQQLTDKSDVYSFGVVLCEVLSAKPAILPAVGSPDKQVLNLAEWVTSCHREGTIDQVVDSNIKHEIAPQCLNIFVETAVGSLRSSGTMRPAMGSVVRSLEAAMELQEGSAPTNSRTGDDKIPETTGPSSHNSGLHGTKEVFSELVYPSGR